MAGGPAEGQALRAAPCQAFLGSGEELCRLTRTSGRPKPSERVERRSRGQETETHPYDLCRLRTYSFESPLRMRTRSKRTELGVVHEGQDGPSSEACSLERQ